MDYESHFETAELAAPSKKKGGTVKAECFSKGGTVKLTHSRKKKRVTRMKGALLRK